MAGLAKWGLIHIVPWRDDEDSITILSGQGCAMSGCTRNSGWHNHINQWLMAAYADKIRQNTLKAVLIVRMTDWD
ncbi:hypothetical protein [Thalassospira marina]|uniref:hypothetical protein n=1 Tax=Thalassospira marina TaxID=2048283 RepID=UPI0012FE80DA|nr:hypothetical protein [Thalassospira marina]